MSGVMSDVVGKGVDCEECVTGEMLRTGWEERGRKRRKKEKKKEANKKKEKEEKEEEDSKYMWD